MRQPATTLLSGPAGGPEAPRLAYVRPHGRDDCILVDMGGTSFDASLVRDGARPCTARARSTACASRCPMLAITTIGAGGGSIGWIDEGGLLRMGPQSAGADPGPACYGRGGERPTCTDADLVLGYLDPGFFAGGAMPLDARRARGDQHTIAEPLGVDVEEAAAGMYRVINTNMAHGVREITVKRGLDPREFPMVVAGGAGPLHACMIATSSRCRCLVVPARSRRALRGGHAAQRPAARLRALLRVPLPRSRPRAPAAAGRETMSAKGTSSSQEGSRRPAPHPS